MSSYFRRERERERELGKQVPVVFLYVTWHQRGQQFLTTIVRSRVVMYYILRTYTHPHTFSSSLLKREETTFVLRDTRT